MDEEYISAQKLAHKIGLAPTTVQTWVRKGMPIALDSLLAVCEYFNCTADYFCCRSEERGRFNKAPIIYIERIKTLLKKNKISMDTLAAKMDAKRSSINNWISGRTKLWSASLIKLADIFGCSIDYILGLEIDETGATSEVAATTDI